MITARAAMLPCYTLKLAGQSPYPWFSLGKEEKARKGGNDANLPLHFAGVGVLLAAQNKALHAETARSVIEDMGGMWKAALSSNRHTHGIHTLHVVSGATLGWRSRKSPSRVEDTINIVRDGLRWRQGRDIQHHRSQQSWPWRTKWQLRADSTATSRSLWA
jgi:hypothetical protein